MPQPITPAILNAADEVEANLDALDVSTRTLLQLLRAGDSGEPPAFSPSDISGLRLWLDASDASTITDAGAGAVSAWNDKSGNAFHVTQGTAGARPTTSARTINSLNALDFDGGDWLSRASSQLVNTTNGEWTAFSVASLDVTGSYRNIVDQDNGSSARIAQFLRVTDATPAAIETITFDTVPNAYVDAGDTISTATAYVFRAVRNNTTIEAFVNASSSGGTAVAGTDRTSAGAFTVGAFASGFSQYWDGAIAEILLYNKALSAGEITQVEAYLANKWGITL